MSLKRISISFLFAFFCITSFAQQEETTTRILFIFDASNSMNAPWQGSSRIDIARRVMARSLDSLKTIPNLEVGLRIYGHQSPLLPGQQDCNDTKLEVPFSPQGAEKAKGWINYVVPKGTTPIARSLEKAGGDFPECKKCRNVIILVTDGIEACDEDPCAIAKALRSKGIIVKPFVIGIGMNMDYLNALECIGTVYDASSEETFKQVLNVVISQALNNTTCQININDIHKKPTETNISFSLYDEKSGALKYHYIHTMNKAGNPDTLTIDPLLTYKLVVHSVPQVEKKGIRLIPQKHNIIEIDAPQGAIETKISGYNKTSSVMMIVRKKGEMNTIYAQHFPEKQDYLVGNYDLEILTLPRIYMTDVKVNQSATTKIEIPLAGTLDLNTPIGGYGAIFQLENGKTNWVCDIKDEFSRQSFNLQPGKYKVVYRNRKTSKTVYTTEKSFTITSGQTTVITL
ncbi:MAG: VWA domain-containing protein [Flavobacteriales bacterium]|nr:VWA domain-containing protein [Flavobacteriales bacterium]